MIGAGYAGLGTAIALAKKGNLVTIIDKDDDKVRRLSRGQSPVFERSLEREIHGLFKSGRVSASMETASIVRESVIVFLCVGTPSTDDGALDTSQIQAASREVGSGLRRKPRQLVVVRSTVVPGTSESVVIPLLESASGLRSGEFGVCVSPEFLREGRALEDSLRPSHIVVGQLDRASGDAFLRLYSSFRCPKFRTSIQVAEAVKYATNAFLATKVTFANELANLCTRLGLDSDEVLRGMVMDPRISPHHLQPGVGFGGSCLPKDLRALVSFSRGRGYEPLLFDSVVTMNNRQHLEAVRLLEEEMGPLTGKKIALLGLSFKVGTDDVRESADGDVRDGCLQLRRRGARVVGYDPRAGENFGQALPGTELARSARAALQGADGCVIHSPWPEITRLKRGDFARMASPVVVDARRTWTRDRVPKGIRYRRIG